MGLGACYYETKNKGRTKISMKENKNQFAEYICTIKIDHTYICGFLCDLKYSNQKCLVPTIITYIDFFPKKFKFEQEIKNITIGYNSGYHKADLNIIFISEDYNIVIFRLDINHRFSYLKIDNNFSNKKNSSYFHFLINGNVTSLVSWNNYIIEKNGYIFNYDRINEKALVLNQNNDIIGITIGKNSNKGILISWIIEKIYKNLKNKEKKIKIVILITQIQMKIIKKVIIKQLILMLYIIEKI